MTALDEPGAALIQALATELAGFCRKPKDGTAYLHVGMGWTSYCDFVADPRMPRPCSARCQAVRAVLALAAERLGCDVAAFYAEPKKRSRAGPPRLDGL